MKRLAVVVVLLTACSSSPGTQPTSAGSSTTTPPTESSTPTPATPSTTLPPLPDLNAVPQHWFGPLPPMPTHPGRPFTGSDDFMDLFVSDASWETAASHLQVFKLYGEWVAYHATDAQLRQAVEDIRRRGLALAVEAGPLDPPPECGEGIEGFAGTDEGALIAQRVIDAGGTIDVIALDEPWFFATTYDGPNACHWEPDLVAAEVGEYIEMMRGFFPDLVVGDTEPTPEPVTAAGLKNWLEVFRDVNGYDLAFLHLDFDWSRIDWPSMGGELVEFGRDFGVPVGVIWIGNGADPTEEVWINIVGERIKRYSAENGEDPDHVLFQSWVDFPDRVLPEGDRYTFTGLMREYFEDREALGYPTEGAGANVARGKPAQASRALSGNEPGYAFDGDSGTVWSAGNDARQWVEVDLEGVYDIAEVRLIPSQFPEGETTHRILGSGPGTGGFQELGVITMFTRDGDYLVVVFEEPWIGIDTVRVETIASPSWVAWREIEVISAG